MTAPYTDKADNVDFYSAAHINAVQNGLKQISFNVKAPNYGAAGDGIVDDTAAFQAAIAAAAAETYGSGTVTRGAEVFVPPGIYKITSTLDLTGCRGIKIRGAKFKAGSDYWSSSTLKFTQTTTAGIDMGSSNNSNILMEYLTLAGSQSSTTSADLDNHAIYGSGATNLNLRGMNIHGWGGCAVKLVSSSFGFRMFESSATGCLYGYLTGNTGGTALDFQTGVIHIEGLEPWLEDCNINGVFAYTTGNYGTGLYASYYLKGAPVWIRDCNAAFSQVGWFLDGAVYGAPSLISNSRGEFNQGHGWVIYGGDIHFSNCWSFDNGFAADATYSGFFVDRDVSSSGFPIRNRFVNCTAANLTSPGGNSNQMKYGFTDDSAGAANTTANSNSYVNCTAPLLDSTGRVFNLTGTIVPSIAPDMRTQAGSLNTTPSPDELTFDGEKGVIWRAAIASGAATKIKATNLLPGQVYTLYIVQPASAGTVTLDTVFAKTATFTSPANSKHLTGQFYSDGTSLYQVGAWSGDM